MRIGIIGTGGRSVAYLPLIEQMEGASLCAVCDIDETRLADFHEKWLARKTNVHAYTDYQELLRDGHIDTVLILTPDTTHRMIRDASITAGKHILLEKPIATPMEDALAIRKKGASSKSTLELGFVLRYTSV